MDRDIDGDEVQAIFDGFHGACLFCGEREFDGEDGVEREDVVTVS